MRGRWAWRRAKVTRRTTPPAGGERGQLLVAWAVGAEFAAWPCVAPRHAGGYRLSSSRDAPVSPAARHATLPRQGPPRAQDVQGGAGR